MTIFQDKWRGYDVVCRHPDNSPNEMACELKKRVGEEVMMGKVTLGWDSSGAPEVLNFEGNPKVVDECTEYAMKKVNVRMK